MKLPSALRWWGTPLVVGGIIGLIIGGGLFAYQSQKPFTANAEILVSATTADSSSGGSDVYSGDQYVSQRMSTYAQIATSDQVILPAAGSLRMDPDALSSQVTAAVVDNTTMLTLDVGGTSAQQAVNEASAVTRSFVDAITRLETVGDVTSRVRLDVVSPPSVPASNQTMSLPLLLILGLIGGAVIGYVLVALIGWLYPKWQASSPARKLDTTG